ncbi:unnamed protein product [Knipowitschia caucasica]|uniref:Uncharacterized protein n=1 Tax=Knipowitschia caucasica TaxID=637954 RepID=A0AAV2L095_KNICA
MAGLLVGVIRMAVDFSFPVPACGEVDTRPAVLSQVHYLYFSLILFALSALVICVVSLATPPLPPHCLHRLTWWSRHSQEPCVNLPGVGASKPQQDRPQAPDSEPQDRPQAPDSESQQDPDSHTGRCYRAVLWMCGLTGQSKPEDPACSTLLSLKEEPLWRHVCNINALLLLTINIFLWGYFA